MRSPRSLRLNCRSPDPERSQWNRWITERNQHRSYNRNFKIPVPPNERIVKSFSFLKFHTECVVFVIYGLAKSLWLVWAEMQLFNQSCPPIHVMIQSYLLAIFVNDINVPDKILCNFAMSNSQPVHQREILTYFQSRTIKRWNSTKQKRNVDLWTFSSNWRWDRNGAIKGLPT